MFERLSVTDGRRTRRFSETSTEGRSAGTGWTGDATWRQIDHMWEDEIWDEDAAERYDTPGAGMFSPAVLAANGRPPRRARR